MSRRPRRNHSPAFKAKVAIAAIKGDRTIVQIAEQFDVHPNQVTAWKAQLEGGAADVFDGGSSTAPVVYGLNRNGPLWIDIASLIAIGFFVYGPIMIIGLHALDLVPVAEFQLVTDTIRRFRTERLDAQARVILGTLSFAYEGEVVPDGGAAGAGGRFVVGGIPAGALENDSRRGEYFPQTILVAFRAALERLIIK